METTPSPLVGPTPFLDASIEEFRASATHLADAEFASSDAFNLQRINLNLTSGDTLVIVRFDEDQASQAVNCNKVVWLTQTFRMDSRKLLDTKSSVFEKLLAPEKQTAERQRSVLRKIGMTRQSFHEDFRFVIDLTPSEEGDEVAANLAQLSLPAGVISWWTTKTRLDISQWVVSGHDDKCPYHRSVIDDETGLSWSREIDDYCPIRHRAAILRLMMLIDNPQYYRLVMDSAARGYTMTVISKIYDCTDLVRDPVYAWLLAGRNEAFVDFNPEVTLEMAWILRIQSVTRAALSIIVVENALEGLAFEDELQSQTADRTKFDRPRGHLQDDLRNVVQYSTRALISRVRNTYDALKGDATIRSIYSWLQIPEWEKLLDIGKIIDVHGDTLPSGISDLEKQALFEARRSFKDVVANLESYGKSVVNSAFTTPSSGQQSMDTSRRFYSQADSFQTTDNIVNGMSDAQTLLTRSFWTKLRQVTIDFDSLVKWSNGYFTLNETLSKLVGLFPDLQRYNLPQKNKFFFDEHTFNSQVSGAFILLHDEWVNDSWARGHPELQLNHTRHLALGLTSAEYKFLPEWAGGDDDGTGRVFEDTDLPDAVMGPAGPGPVYHTGETVATEASTIAPSSPTETVSDMVSMTLGNSIAPAVTDGSATADHDDGEYSLINFSQADESENGWLSPNINTQ